jgi:hypothetical protein
LISIERNVTDSFYVSVQGNFIDINPNEGGPIPYAHITFTMYKKKYELVTDSVGRFQTSNLIPGHYKMWAGVVGYDALIIDSLYFKAGETIDMKIGLGGKHNFY